MGEGTGTGYNVNVPLNVTGNADSDYLAAFLSVLLPVATEFDPELVLVSAGYDAALGCPEGEQEVGEQRNEQMPLIWLLDILYLH